MDYFLFFLAIFIGTLSSALLSCLPALHIYNVVGILLLFAMSLEEVLPGPALAAFLMSMVVGYSFLNTIPSIFLGAPDESAIFITLPGNRYLMQGKGFEAALLTGIGSLGAVAFLTLLVPFAPLFFPLVRRVLTPHLFWILAAVLFFLIMSEWPKGGQRGKTPWHRLWDGWKNLLAGLATLLLSGLLGFAILYKPIMPIEYAFQNIMPAFVGLFAIPWILQNLLSKGEPPKQHIGESLDITLPLALRGIGAGSLGGLFAAVFPIVTGGIGGLIAGHATGQRDDRLFIISQGASKVVYYVGAFMLLFVPGLSLTRGGMAWMLSGFYRPLGWESYYMIMATIVFSGVLSFFLLLLFSQWAIRLIEKINWRTASWITLFFVLFVVWYITGLAGIALMTVASGIGMIPVFFHSRRSNCMGVLLIPITLNMAGLGPTVAHWLGLV